MRELEEADRRDMRVPERYWGVELDKISDRPPGKGVPSARSIVSHYVDNIRDMYARGYGLMLWGDNGVGKTGAGVYLLKQARARRYPSLFMSAADTLGAYRVEYKKDTSLWDRAHAVPFLLLDDLGKGAIDSKDRLPRLLDELFRHRMAHQRVTIVTTNMNPHKSLFSDSGPLRLKHSTQAAMKESIMPLQVVGPDLRDEKFKEMASFMRPDNAVGRGGK